MANTDGDCNTKFEVKQADSEQTKPTEGDKTDTTTPTDSGTDNPNTGTPSDAESPQTGDNSNMLLWVTLLFVSIAGTLGTVVYRNRKNHISD